MTVSLDDSSAAHTPRFGWCCVYVPPDGDPEAARRMNFGRVTVTALQRLGPAERVAKLLELLCRNIAALEAQLREVAAGPPYRRLLRISSGLLPVYSHPIARPLYQEAQVRETVESGLERAGSIAREAGIRLGFHPDQFCVLNSANPAVLANSVAELDYHAEALGLMGFAGSWHPGGAHINIHGGGRAEGIVGFQRGLTHLSADARNLITVENDEMSFGLDDLLPLADDLPIVLDLHHHWIKSGGEYIQPDDPRIETVRRSWRLVRPVAHVSVSRETVLIGHSPDERPDFRSAVASGRGRADLRAHSDRMWNRAVNALVAAHLSWADFEIEAKAKNLAADDLERDLLAAGLLQPEPAGAA